ncbi:hypothetical protein HUJ04_005150 [Dendroctonus ponderosae]|nr:hypothetical protein HUJ04_005150 [Dendroctonus ponderosae]
MSQTICTRGISQSARLGHRLIKFRYGPNRNQQAPAGSQTIRQGASKSTSSSSQEPIWDFQIPVRWRRAPLSEEECAVINNGGPV